VTLFGDDDFGEAIDARHFLTPLVDLGMVVGGLARVYGLAEVIVAKQRHGSTGKVRLKFDSRITKFSDLVDEGYMPEMRGS
jgi:replicative DNA helicase